MGGQSACDRGWDIPALSDDVLNDGPREKPSFSGAQQKLSTSICLCYPLGWTELVANLGRC